MALYFRFYKAGNMNIPPTTKTLGRRTCRRKFDPKKYGWFFHKGKKSDCKLKDMPLQKLYEQ